jgi:hypothetical protein
MKSRVAKSKNNDLPMRALTIRQPWAELILRGRKRFELRSWKTKYRGPLVIHAAAHVHNNFAVELGLNPDRLVSGAFVGVAILKEVRPFTRADSKLLLKRRADIGGWESGLYSWVLTRPRRLARPIRGKGKLGLGRVAPAVAREICKLL